MKSRSIGSKTAKKNSSLDKKKDSRRFGAISRHNLQTISAPFEKSNQFTKKNSPGPKKPQSLT